MRMMIVQVSLQASDSSNSKPDYGSKDELKASGDAIDSQWLVVAVKVMALYYCSDSGNITMVLLFEVLGDSSTALDNHIFNNYSVFEQVIRK